MSARPHPSLPPSRDIEWFRPDPGRRLIKPFALGTLFLTAGLGATAYGFSQLADSEAVALGAIIGGLSCVVLGMLTFTVAALHALSDDTCIGLRVDGLFARSGNEPGQLYPWDTLGEVRVEEEHVLVVPIDGAEELRLPARFAEIEPAVLAARINTLRRRALMGLPLRTD